MRLSVLDQSIAVAGRPHDQSIRNTVALAQHCEALGYDRFWVSEHHNHPTIVGTAPEIVIAAIAATTHRIRIGSDGLDGRVNLDVANVPTATVDLQSVEVADLNGGGGSDVLDAGSEAA